MTPEELEQIIPILIGAMIIEGVALSILTYLVLTGKGEPPSIKEVFTVYKDGRLIEHTGREGEEYQDDDIFAAMLTAVQAFIKDSFRSRESTDVDGIKFGKRSVCFERGEMIYLAVVYTGDYNKKMRARIILAIDEIEKKYAKALKRWDGDMDKFRGVGKSVEPLLDINGVKRKK